MSSTSPERIRQRLAGADFTGLFVEELGWNHLRARPLHLLVEGESFEITPVAEKRGFAVYTCSPRADGGIPRYPERRKLERQVAKLAHEHLIVYIEARKTSQVWQWVRREAGRPAVCREHIFRASQTGEALVQRLQSIAFELRDEERLTILHVAERARAAFDVERVTKRFYDRFRAEHDAFLGFIKGIAAAADKTWYASLMLNRMMFVYFIQKKGFLDGDADYLRHRLAATQAASGKDRFHGFYRFFLLRLFHEGLARPTAGRAPELVRLLGNVPYLNGGLFDVHDLEQGEQDIQIPDEAFERVFAFFDAYSWHLDDRPMRADNEINPDVLGFIFEKYINQKEMGAYYTKDDITGYIARNTLLPVLLGALAEIDPAAFAPHGRAWRLLAEDPDRYIWEAVRTGCDLPLPDTISVGVENVQRRERWNALAPPPYALPTETWREHIGRRKRCDALRDKLRAEELSSISELITLNLDSLTLCEDLIAATDEPEILQKLWAVLSNISVLDPTCGSGAFLFAALNLLEVLYEACIDAMQGWLDDTKASAAGGHKSAITSFRAVLEEIGKHPNRRYFILKSIVVGNLFGVDLMEEASEICKLRLFLKLVAQVEEPSQLEPLPDIDFNIRAGNTLVGFGSPEAVRRAMTTDVSGQQRMLYAEEAEGLRRIESQGQETDAVFTEFRALQVASDSDHGRLVRAKVRLRDRLRELREQLDQLLATQYGVSKQSPKALGRWIESHRPFHWFVEFYGIMSSGGFDVIVGNPPYVELAAVTEYGTLGYRTQSAGNLYALVMERCLDLVGESGRIGVIVPVSSISTDRYEALQDLIRGREAHYSSYDDRPSRLFDGLEHIRLTIHLLGRRTKEATLWSTNYQKWLAPARGHLFDVLSYVGSVGGAVEGTMPKLCAAVEQDILLKLGKEGARMADFLVSRGESTVRYSRKVGHFLQVLDFEPEVRDGRGNLRPPSEFKELRFADQHQASAALCCLNSSLFYWFVTVHSDCRHLNKREIEAFPVNLRKLSTGPGQKALEEVGKRLMRDLKKNSETRQMRFRHDTLTVQCIIPRQSKPILDEVDVLLAKHFELTAEELDFVLNYDIKFRLGAEEDAD